MNRWIVLAPVKGAGLPDRMPWKEEEWQRFSCGPAKAYVRRDGRFSGDQVFDADKKGILFADGVLLNLAELKAEYRTDSLPEIVRRSGAETNGVFFKRFIGPFCGSFYDAERDELSAYGNQTGDTFVFYSCARGCRIISNDFNLVDAVLRENGAERTFNEAAAACLLSFGFMIDGKTQVREIMRVLPGEYVRMDGAGRTEPFKYHFFSFQPRETAMDKAIELVDQGFRAAVRRCFEKDREYGAEEHLADLSGGLDSRMTAWVAHDMGYGPAVYLNYCQSGSKEVNCASRVASELDGQFYHKQLDDAAFLYEIDRLVEMNYGLSLYCGITGGEQMLRTLDTSRFVLEHTGQIGDAVIGVLGDVTRKKGQDVAHTIRNSSKAVWEVPPETIGSFETPEAFAMYTRVFLGALSSHVIRRHYICAASPFMDPDFLSLCFSLPLELRKDHALYWAWVDRKYPRAGRLPATRSRPDLTGFSDGRGDTRSERKRPFWRPGARGCSRSPTEA